MNENQLLGFYWPSSNKTWRLVNCIQNVKYGYRLDDPDVEVEGGSNYIECVQFATFQVISLTLIVLFSILLSFQIKKYGSLANLEIFKRVKTWVYICAIFNLIFVFVDNLIRPASY